MSPPSPQTNLPDREHVAKMLRRLGHSPRPKTDEALPYEWILIVNCPPGLDVGVAPAPKKAALQVDIGIEFPEAVFRDLQQRLGTPGMAELIGKIRLLILGEHVDYNFQLGKIGDRRLQIFDYVTEDVVNIEKLDQTIRKVRDTALKVIVALEMALAVTHDEDSPAPKPLQEKTGFKTLVTAAQGIPVDNESLDRFIKAKPGGMDPSEFLNELLDLYEKHTNA